MPWREDNEEAKEEEGTIHFTASDENVQLLLKMVISVNQRNLYEAVADLIKELPDDQRAPGKPVASDQMEQEILIHPPLAEVPSNNKRQGNLLQITSEDLKKLPEDQKPSKLCSEAGLNLVEVGQFFFVLPSPNAVKNRSLCREYSLPETKRKIVQKGGSKAMHDSALSRKHTRKIQC